MSRNGGKASCFRAKNKTSYRESSQVHTGGLTMQMNETRKDYSRFKEFLLRDETQTSCKKSFLTVREAARELGSVVAEADRLPATGMLLVDERVMTRLASELERLTIE